MNKAPGVFEIPELCSFRLKNAKSAVKVTLTVKLVVLRTHFYL